MSELKSDNAVLAEASRLFEQANGSPRTLRDIEKLLLESGSPLLHAGFMHFVAWASIQAQFVNEWLPALEVEVQKYGGETRKMKADLNEAVETIRVIKTRHNYSAFVLYGIFLLFIAGWLMLGGSVFALVAGAFCAVFNQSIEFVVDWLLKRRAPSEGKV